MKTSLAALIITGLFAGLADATPARNLNKRRAEKKRDAQKSVEATQAHTPQPAQSGPQSARPAATAAAGQNAPAPSQSAAPTPSATTPAPTPAAAAAPPAPAGPSQLSREGKPPSRRFFSRLRSDSSRDKARSAKIAKAQAERAAEPKKDTNLIYRRSWGPRAHRRPR